MKKICVCFVVVLSVIFSFFPMSQALENELTVSIKLNGNVISVWGSSSVPREEVNIFLLNPGKTVSDLNAADNETLFSDTVNYCNMVTSDSFGRFKDGFEINAMAENRQYLLYVKTETQSYTAYVKKPECIYVSKNGDDAAGDGTQEKPYATIEKAKSEVKNKAGDVPVEVIIGGGRYNIERGLVFDSSDSGTKDAPVTYRAADGEKVILQGTKRLDTSKFTKITDETVAQRLPEGAAGKVVEIDLSEQGIERSVADYLAKHSVGARGKTIGVYLNDKPQTVSRWPNVGFEKILTGSTPGGSVSAETTGLGGAVVRISNLDSERAKRWKTAENMYVDGYLGTDWHGEWAKVDSVDESAPSVLLDTYTQYGVSPGRRISVVNLLEEIDIPGEWYADFETMKMYYYPPHELTDKDTFEIAVLCDNFISLQGAEFINFEGIEFAKNADSPLYAVNNTFGGNGIAIISGSSDINITDCILRDIGMDGIIINDSDNVTVDGCIIYNTGFSAVAVSSGNRAELTSGNTVISNCHISNINRDTGSNGMAGIRITGGVGTVIENNIFQNIANSAVRYAGNGHIIRNNEIFNCVNETADAGAIYSGRNWSNYGTSIINNYFHDIGAGIDSSYQASAVFWDDNHSGNAFIGNIVDMNNHIKTSGVKIGGGRDNRVSGNIFVNSAYGVFGEDRNVNPPDDYDANDKNNFYNGTAFQSFKEAAENISNAYYITDDDWYDAFLESYPQIMVNFKDIMKNKSYRRAETITDNVSYNCSEKGIYTPSKMTADSIIGNNYDAKNGDIFVNASEGDYRIKAEAKKTLGMRDILDETFEMSDIGISDDSLINISAAEFALVFPTDNAGIADTETLLKWEKSPFADEYIYEIASDSSFENIIDCGTTPYNVVKVSGLQEESEYFWRVTAVNKSKQIGGKYRCNSIFRFTTSGELLFENIVYDKVMREISFDVSNTKKQQDMFTVIIAAKSDSGELLALRTSGKTVDAEDKKTMFIGTYFDGIDMNSVEIEFYIWNSMNGMMNLIDKKVF